METLMLDDENEFFESIDIDPDDLMIEIKEPTKPKRKKKYFQKYRKEWEKLDNFKGKSTK